MISAGEIGAVFTIVDRASAALREIAAQLRVLDERTLKAKEALTALASTRFTGLATRIAEINKAIGRTGEVSATTSSELDKVAATVSASFARIDASVAPALASVKTLRAELAGVAAASRAIGSGAPPSIRSRGSHGGGGGAGGAGGHWGSFGVPLPGGAHYRMPSGPALATAGVFGYAMHEEAKMQDAVFQLMYHSGLANTAANKSRFRNIIQQSMSESGYSLDNISEAAKTEIRMFKGTPGGGIDVLPELLRAATIEARLKGTSVQESMNSLIGLAHMTKQYDPEAIKKLAPAFAFLSASNPSSLSSMERAAGYAVPILQSGLEIDPMSTLLFGTVLTRAGITSTKSGTWLRNMFQNALPGTSLMSKQAFKKHEEVLKELGLVDDKGNATWFTNGKPDAFKMLDIASQRAAGMDLTHRAAAEKALFGTQGEGGFAILGDPAIRKQVDALRKEKDSADFKNRYSTFAEQYAVNSPVQEARKTWADLQNVLMDIGSTVLPPVVIGLRALDEILKAIKQHTGEAVGNTIIGGGILTGVAAWLTKGLWGGSGGGGAGAVVRGSLKGGLVMGLLGAAGALGIDKMFPLTGDEQAFKDKSIGERLKDVWKGIVPKPQAGPDAPLDQQYPGLISPMAFHPSGMSNDRASKQVADLLSTGTQQGVLDGLIKVSDSAKAVIASWFSGGGGGGGGGGAGGVQLASYDSVAPSDAISKIKSAIGSGAGGGYAGRAVGAVGGAGWANKAQWLIGKMQADFGLTYAQAAGAVGWMSAESGGTLSPTARGPGGDTGWAQWVGGRRAGLMSLGPLSDATNYAWMTYELTKAKYKNVLPMLRNARSWQEAIAIWGEYYEGAKGTPRGWAGELRLHSGWGAKVMGLPHLPPPAPSRPHQQSHVHNIYLDGKKIAQTMSRHLAALNTHPRQAPYADPGLGYSSLDYGYTTG